MLNVVTSPTGYNDPKVNWTVLEMHVSGVLQIHRRCCFLFDKLSVVVSPHLLTTAGKKREFRFHPIKEAVMEEPADITPWLDQLDDTMKEKVQQIQKTR